MHSSSNPGHDTTAYIDPPSSNTIQLSCDHVTPLQAVWHNPHVVVLRDQGTIEALAKRLPGMRRVVLVGNGGIALEVAHSLTGVEVFPGT